MTCTATVFEGSISTTALNSTSRRLSRQSVSWVIDAPPLPEAAVLLLLLVDVTEAAEVNAMAELSK